MKSKTLKEIRLEHDLLQSDVARECGIGTSYYCLIEKGKRTPTLKTARRISGFFDMTLDEFYEVLENHD